MKWDWIEENASLTPLAHPMAPIVKNEVIKIKGIDVAHPISFGWGINVSIEIMPH